MNPIDQEMSKTSKPWELYFDGACEPFNPGGHATYGWVINSPDGVTVLKGNGHVCSGEGATNNVAEYHALLEGLKAFISLGNSNPVLLKGDSQLVIKTVNQEWNCKKPHLKVILLRIQTLLSELEWEAEWIPRELNSPADEMSKSAVIPRNSKVKRFRKT